MYAIPIITRDPESVQDYFVFGCREVERGKTGFDDHVVIAECPDRNDAEYNSARLCSGLHGATVVDDLDAWKTEWNYVKNKDTTKQLSAD